jgi:hypothetical protein
VCVCVCLLLQDLVQSCLHGGGEGYGRTCATRDHEPRPVKTSENYEPPSAWRLKTSLLDQKVSVHYILLGV